MYISWTLDLLATFHNTLKHNSFTVSNLHTKINLETCYEQIAQSDRSEKKHDMLMKYWFIAYCEQISCDVLNDAYIRTS